MNEDLANPNHLKEAVTFAVTEPFKMTFLYLQFLDSIVKIDENRRL